MLTITKVFKHFGTITKHKWLVFKLAVKAGIPLRGLLHDLSKYSPAEFIEGVKYYNGKRSPNACAKEDYGYSKAWIHHFGRNKHHHQYWHDYDTPNQTPMMPYKYVVEMICDDLSAGITYMGKDWYPGYQLKYWENRKDRLKVNENLKDLLTEVLTDVEKNGIDKVINKKKLKRLYAKYNAKELAKNKNR